MTAQLISFLLFLLLFGTSSCLGSGGTGPSPAGNGAPNDLFSSPGAGGAPSGGPGDDPSGDSPEEGAIPATPERPPVTAMPAPKDDCYNIVHQLGPYRDNPAPPEAVALCEEILRCLAYVQNRKEGIEVPFDKECEEIYQAEAEARARQLERAMLPSPPAIQPLEPRALPDPNRPDLGLQRRFQVPRAFDHLNQKESPLLFDDKTDR